MSMPLDISVLYPNIKNIVAIENVQIIATKELPGMSSLTYAERTNKLKLPSIAYRCLRGDMIDVFIIIHIIYDNESSPKVLKWDEKSFRTGNIGHILICFTQRAKKNKKNIENAFPLRVMEPWNSLPETIVLANP